MAQNISIQDLLQAVRNPTIKTFSISFVRSSGNKAGSIKTIDKCVYGSAKRVKVSNSNSKSLHNTSGTIPLRDQQKNKADGGQYLTILISHIIGFNSFKVIH